jgi:hypothetical protein
MISNVESEYILKKHERFDTMGQEAGTVRVTGKFAPSDTTDTYPTHDSQYGKGGYHQVADAAARLAIPAARRTADMLVRQADTAAFWTLQGGIADGNWVQLPMSGTVVITYWSVFQASVDITDSATDQALPSVVVPALPTGYSIYRAEGVLSFRKVVDDSGSDNALDGNQNVQLQKGAGAFATCIALLDEMLGVVADSESGGDALVGSVDVKTTVDGAATYGFKITSALALGDTLMLKDVQTAVRLTLTPT